MPLYNFKLLTKIMNFFQNIFHKNMNFSKALFQYLAHSQFSKPFLNNSNLSNLSNLQVLVRNEIHSFILSICFVVFLIIFYYFQLIPVNLSSTMTIFLTNLNYFEKVLNLFINETKLQTNQCYFKNILKQINYFVSVVFRKRLRKLNKF